MTDIFGQYDGATLEASFRGVDFVMVDSRHPPGRRLMRFLFPGQDISVFQDLGQDDRDIKIAGLMIGDDYLQQAADLETAFQTPGPATLVHPWLGNIQVILLPGPEISFVQEELRVVRFSASFARIYPRQPPVFDTQENLFDLLNDLRNAAFMLLDQVLGVVSLGLSVVSYVRGFVGSVIGFFNLAVLDVSGLTSELLGPAIGTSLNTLAGVDTLPLTADFGGSVGSALAGPSAAVVAAAQPAIPAAVAPGGATMPATPVDARIAANFLLGVVASVAAKASDSAPGPLIALATQALILADAVTAASDIVFTSQQDATAWETTLLAALDALATAAMIQGAAYPLTAGIIWRAAIDARAALSADMSAVIGRLPAVRQIVLPRPVPVWLLAQYLAGDTPELVFATYQDLVARNNIVNPCLTPSRPIEILQAT